jgi:hypothetical protein
VNPLEVATGVEDSRSADTDIYVGVSEDERS